jgi:hypothetical protein
MVITATIQVNLKNAMENLAAWADNELTINNRKTKIMKFRREGRITEDGIYCDGKKLESVSTLKYLASILQTTGITFSIHVTELCF